MKTESGGSRKRKRVSDEATMKPHPDAEDNSIEAITPIKKPSSPAQSVDGVKELDEMADLDMIEQESPSKRIRKQPLRLNMVVYQDESDESHLNSSGTEFFPEEVATSVGQENGIKAEDEDWA